MRQLSRGPEAHLSRTPGSPVAERFPQEFRLNCRVIHERSERRMRPSASCRKRASSVGNPLQGLVRCLTLARCEFPVSLMWRILSKGYRTGARQSWTGTPASPMPVTLKPLLRDLVERWPHTRSNIQVALRRTSVQRHLSTLSCRTVDLLLALLKSAEERASTSAFAWGGSRLVRCSSFSDRSFLSR